MEGCFIYGGISTGKNIWREFMTTGDYPKGKGAIAFSFLIREKNAGCSGNSDKNISLILKNEALEV